MKPRKIDERLLPTQISMPRALLEELDVQAARLGIERGRSQLIRRACQEWVERMRQEPQHITQEAVR